MELVATPRTETESELEVTPRVKLESVSEIKSRNEEQGAGTRQEGRNLVSGDLAIVIRPSN